MAHDRKTFEHPDIGKVRICTCGSVHLTVGNTTLHLDRDDLEALGELIATATEPPEPPRVMPNVVGEA